MNDHIDTAAEREKLAAVLNETYLRCESCNEDMDCYDPSVMWLHHGKPICDSCADESEIPVEELDSAPDPVRVAVRLLDALDAERARAERAEAEQEALRKEVASYHDAYEQAKEGRDQALARLAVAQRETMLRCLAIVQEIDTRVDADPLMVGRESHVIGEAELGIISLPLDLDAEAALQRVVDGVWNGAALLQRAVDLIRGDLVGSEWKKACNEFVKDARRALKRPEDSHE